MLTVGTLTAMISTLAVAPSASPTPSAGYAAPRINVQGVFRDRAGWMYTDAAGARSVSAPYEGTNEFLQLPPPSPPPGGAVVGIEILRHPGDRMGYPIHISMLAKTYARVKGLQVIYLADSATSVYRYDVAETVWNEHTVQGEDDHGEVIGTAGPISATAAVPSEYETAFDFAKADLDSIVNLPSAQKTLANYDLGFVETQDTIWIEFEPHYGTNEDPHLGCQTQLGRDMVFGFEKTDLAQNKSASRFLQCF